jgi:hypothetical protein
MKFIGIADCHGLESFIPARRINADTELFDERKGDIAMMVLRANANTQRRALVFRVEISLEDATAIEEMMEDGDYIDALNELKEKATKVEIAGGAGINKQKAWDSIPNPDLDPYH